MKHPSIQWPNVPLTTLERFQLEKSWVSLSSSERPNKEKIISCSLRQTQFPSLLNRG